MRASDFVGRVGGLAVALGIGLACGGGVGSAWAAPAQSPSPADGAADATSAAGSQRSAASEARASRSERSSRSADPGGRTAGRGSGVGSSAALNQASAVPESDGIDAVANDGPALQISVPASASSDAGLVLSATKVPAPEAVTAPVPAAGGSIDDGSALAEGDQAEHTGVVAVVDDAPMIVAGAGNDAVVESVLDPLSGTGPNGPGGSPAAWAMLAAARRELSGDAAIDTTIALTTTTGELLEATPLRGASGSRGAAGESLVPGLQSVAPVSAVTAADPFTAIIEFLTSVDPVGAIAMIVEQVQAVVSRVVAVIAQFVGVIPRVVGAFISGSFSDVVTIVGDLVESIRGVLEPFIGPVAGQADTSSAGRFPFAAAAVPSQLTGARHVLTGGELFLGGNFIELGISDVGSFGTKTSKPGGFVGGTPPGSNPNSIGLTYDSDAFGSGVAPALDFYVPDTPEERWSVAFNDSKYAGFSALNGSSGNANSLTDISLVDGSSGDTLSGTFTATVNGVLKVSQVHSFNVNDSFYKTEVTLTNVSGANLTNVEFMRSFDPDGTRSVGGSNTTTNVVGGQFATEGYSLVSAASLEGDAYNLLTGDLAVAFLYARKAPNAIAYTYGFTNDNPYEFDGLGQSTGYTSVRDDAIGIVFKAGDLAPGGVARFTYYTGVTISDDPLSVVTEVAASTSTSGVLFGDPGTSPITGQPTVEQFIRGVLSFVQTSISGLLNQAARALEAVASTWLSLLLPPIAAPTTAAGLYDRLYTKAQNSPNGVWIDKIEASDGTRFVVYLGGTVIGNDQGFWANLPAYNGQVDENILSIIDGALVEGGGSLGAKVMLVGFSQGGMDAQNFAEKTNLNVTTVVTFGSPALYDPPSDYRIVMMGAVGDPVVGLSRPIAAFNNLRRGNLFASLTDTFNSYALQFWDPLRFLNMHGDRETYVQVGNAFDRSSDETYAAVKDNISKFNGVVVDSWS